jgi:hypothetical protein
MRRIQTALSCALSILCIAFLALPASAQDEEWNLKRYVTGTPSTLYFSVDEVKPATGAVHFSGHNDARPSEPYTIDWGDGSTDTLTASGTSGFGAEHTYQDATRNYTVALTAHYSDQTADTAEAAVFFVAPEVSPVSLPASLAVTIPRTPVALTSRYAWIPSPPSYKAFDDGFFTIVPRTTAEYVLTAAAAVEEDFTNVNHDLVDGAFQQVILLDPAGHGARALFFTEPLGVASADYELEGAFRWSVLIHELAHNFQLNAAAGFSFGSKVDGHAGYLPWESVARIFQCAAGYELINNRERYGIGEDLAGAIGQNTIEMAKSYRTYYEDYLANGKPFTSWSESNSSTNMMRTICTLSTRFCIHAEEQGQGYRRPVKRMMRLIETFDQEALDKFDVDHDSASGATFRSTFLVAALSFAFDEDLRQEFRGLNFPISDADYQALWAKAETGLPDFALTVSPAELEVPRGTSGSFTVAVEAVGGLTQPVELSYAASADVPGVTLELSSTSVEPGESATLTVQAAQAAEISSFSVSFRGTGEYTIHSADASATVVQVPTIGSASFASKTLTLTGSGFGTGPRVQVNGVDETAKIVSASDTSIALKGKKKKLGLHAGENRIVVTDAAGRSSAEYVLTL